MKKIGAKFKLGSSVSSGSTQQVHGEEVVEVIEEMMIRATDPSSG